MAHAGLTDQILVRRQITGHALKISQFFADLTLEAPCGVDCGFLQAQGHAFGDIGIGQRAVVANGIEQTADQGGEKKDGQYHWRQFGHARIRLQT